MKKNAVKHISSAVLSAVQVVVDGLSSARQIVDFTSAPWAKYASCCGGLVEGEIYRKNIVEAYEKFEWLGRSALLSYLLIQQFESELASIVKNEKELAEKLHGFFSELDEKKKIYNLSHLEQIGLTIHIGLFNNRKSNPLTIADLEAPIRYLSALERENRFSIEHKQFAILKEEFSSLKKLKEDNSCAFIDCYKVNKDFLQEAIAHKLEKSAIEPAEKRLKILRKMLVDRIVYNKNWGFLNVTPQNPDLIAFEQNANKNGINRTLQKLPVLDAINPHLIARLQEKLFGSSLKLWFLRFGSLLSITAGIAMGVVTFYTFPAVLTGLGLSLSLTILSAVMWPLAILAAISYSILIYNILSDLIINESVTRWWKKLNGEMKQKYGELHLCKYVFLIIYKTFTQALIKIGHWLQPQLQESHFIYGVRIVLSLLVLGCSVISALTVGYTAFIQLQGYVGLAVCVITALPLLLSDLIFGLKNSFDSISLLTSVSLANLINPLAKHWKILTEQMSTENGLQIALHVLRLPFKLLLSIFKLTIFLFHVFFISVASDRFFNFPCWLTLLFTMGSELLTDICPLFGANKNQEHDHEHGGLFNWIAKLIFIIPATLLGILNALFSQLNRWSVDPNRKLLSPWEAIKQEWFQFDILHTHAEKENGAVRQIGQEGALPKSLVLQKAIKMCDKQISRLDNGFFKLAQEKKMVFVEYRKKLVNAYRTDSPLPVISINQEKRLAQPRFFSCAETTSMKKINKIQLLFKEHDLALSCNEPVYRGT
jgi:hypothetical protein